MAGKKSQISLVDFVILQFFYVFHSVYDTVLSIFNGEFWKKSPPAVAPPSPTNEKRHFIQLYKTEPENEDEKPICFMNIIEFDSSCTPDEIRKRKLSYDFENSRKMLCYQRHQRTRSDNEVERFYRKNLRY